MARGLSRLELKRLRRAIVRGSRYWFSRLILEQSAPTSSAFAQCRHEAGARMTSACALRTWKKRRYHELRAQGLTARQVKARMNGTTPEYEQWKALRNQRLRRERYGGQPSNVGSEAWYRWMLAKE